MATSPQSNNNSTFGIKVSLPNVNVNNASPSQLMYSNNYSAETFYASNGSITFGNLKDGGQGMATYDSSNNLLFKMDGQTWYWYDTNGNNIMQVGLLPDGSYGWAVATPGNSVGSAF